MHSGIGLILLGLIQLASAIGALTGFVTLLGFLIHLAIARGRLKPLPPLAGAKWLRGTCLGFGLAFAASGVVTLLRPEIKMGAPPLWLVLAIAGGLGWRHFQEKVSSTKPTTLAKPDSADLS